MLNQRPQRHLMSNSDLNTIMPHKFRKGQVPLPECGLYTGRRSFGNVAFVVGTTPRNGYEREFSDQHPNDLSKVYPERRGMACAWAATYIGTLASCAGHITNNTSGSYQADQANAYVWIAATTTGTAGVSLSIYAGDYNITLGSLPSVYASSFDVIKTGYTHSAINLTRTIDLIHVKKPQYTDQTQVPGTNRWCDNSYGDHCYIWGTFH